MARILVVDDEQEVVDLLVWLFETEGFEVEGVTVAREALVRIKEVRPDLVLLDLMMPEISGTIICREIKSDPETATIPVVFLSGHGRLEQETEEAHAEGYIWKPFDLDEVLSSVRLFLKSSRRAGTL